MSSSWVKVYSSDKAHEVEIIKAFLLDYDIHAFTIDKQDSMYKFLTNGEIEIFVQGEDVMKAKKLLSENSF